MKKNNPIRMCITCRKRESQKTLMRLQLVDNSIVTYQGFGRSIYLCQECSLNEKKMNGMAKRFKVARSEVSTILKELEKNG
jgi:predicted RNA-binding protein YlxR (DUF448 family)